MANPSRLLFFAQPAAVPDPAMQCSTDPQVNWESLAEDLGIVRHTRANLLVVGPDYLVMNVIRRVIADAPANIVSPSPGGHLPLSRLMLSPGAVVFLDVDELDADGQALLFDWLESTSAERQIVCTASTSLLPLVEAGTFDPDLYYRVNTVSIRLGQ